MGLLQFEGRRILANTISSYETGDRGLARLAGRILFFCFLFIYLFVVVVVVVVVLFFHLPVGSFSPVTETKKMPDSLL